MPARVFAKILGTINSGFKALGQISRVYLRSSFTTLSHAVLSYDYTTGSYFPPDWDQHIVINNDIGRELNALKNVLHQINGQPILTSKSGITLNKLLEKVSNKSNKSITSEPKLGNPKPRSGLICPSLNNYEVQVFASDSSQSTEFAFNVQDPGQVHFAEMSERDRESSSGHRELKSILNCLKAHPEFFQSKSPAKVYWLIDSQNVYSWLTRGSRKVEVQNDVVQILAKLRQLNLVLDPILVPREHQIIVQADLAGKFKDTDGWSIDDVSLESIQQVGGERFTCDVFAHSSNHRCSKFYSLLPSAGTSGVNAFTMDWSKDYNFICPPVKDIIYVIRHIVSNPCRGALVVPFFQGYSFWNFLRKEGGSFIEIIKRSFTFCPNLYGGCVEKKQL